MFYAREVTYVSTYAPGLHTQKPKREATVIFAALRRPGH